ncbi:MAG TPA: hypothetical protein VFX34_02625, partial [Sporosarcina sp.]|nr:hypothetical protein [Sporosarcina sp.]
KSIEEFLALFKGIHVKRDFSVKEGKGFKYSARINDRSVIFLHDYIKIDKRYYKADDVLPEDKIEEFYEGHVSSD